MLQDLGLYRAIVIDLFLRKKVNRTPEKLIKFLDHHYKVELDLAESRQIIATRKVYFELQVGEWEHKDFLEFLSGYPVFN